MDLNKLIIGSKDNPDAHIKVDDPAVSFNHAELSFLEKTKLLVKDLNSANGTVINDRYVLSKVIDESSILKIGQNVFTGAELLIQSKLIVNKSKIQFFEEFKELEDSFKDYKINSKRLNSSYKLKVSLVRYGLPLVFLVVFLVFGETLGIPQNLRLMIPLLGGGIATLFAERLFSQDDLKHQIQELKEFYQEVLICPKCRMELINKSFSYWAKKRKCPKCKANWVES